jgi:hypothetical protein
MVSYSNNMNQSEKEQLLARSNESTYQCSPPPHVIASGDSDEEEFEDFEEEGAIIHVEFDPIRLQHFVRFVGGIVDGFLSIILLIAALCEFSEHGHFKFNMQNMWLFVILFLVGQTLLGIFMFGGFTTLKSQQCKITHSSIIYKSGFLFCKTIKHVPLDQIQIITVTHTKFNYCFQSKFLFDQLGINTLSSSSCGQRPEISMIGLSNAHEIRKLILQRREKKISSKSFTNMEMRKRKE